jgi:hypothetical protein
MRIDSALEPHERAKLDSGNEFAEGLMLLRASTLKMIRLQLAIGRSDRRVVLESVDGLVALDRRLQDYLETVPATGEQLMFRRELNFERAALNEEKLTLAAEVIRKPLNSEERSDHEEAAGRIVEPDGDWHALDGPERPRRSLWWPATLPVLAGALAAATYFLSVGDAAAWLSAALGAVR